MVNKDPLLEVLVIEGKRPHMQYTPKGTGLLSKDADRKRFQNDPDPNVSEDNLSPVGRAILAAFRGTKIFRNNIKSIRIGPFTVDVYFAHAGNRDRAEKKEEIYKMILEVVKRFQSIDAPALRT